MNFLGALNLLKLFHAAQTHVQEQFQALTSSFGPNQWPTFNLWWSWKAKRHKEGRTNNDLVLLRSDQVNIFVQQGSEHSF